MKNYRKICVLLLCLAFIQVAAQAGQVVVSPGQRIQSAINAAGNGDVIVVQPGTYQENLDFKGKNIVVDQIV